MRFEIERKFLVANDGWRAAVIDSDRFRDGLIGEFEGPRSESASVKTPHRLAVKGPRAGPRRLEFEYAIP